MGKSKTKTAYRILIAHEGETLESKDVDEILKSAWDGQVSRDVKITSHPLAPRAWTSDEQLAYAWFAWREMLHHLYGQHPYWEDHETHAYRGTIVSTGHHFYTEIYYKEE